MRRLALSLLAWIFVTAPQCAGQIQPCQEKEFSKDRQLELCAKYSPISGALLLRPKKGEPCACDCSRFPQTYPSIDSLGRALADYPVRLRAWMTALSSRSTECATEDVRFQVTADWRRVIVCRSGKFCHIDERVGMIAQRAMVALASSRSKGADGLPEGDPKRKALECDNDRPEVIGTVTVEHGRTGCAAPGNDYSSEVVLPRMFLDNPEVGEELIVFFLLHEAAHLQCNDRTEDQCDTWAIRTGLPVFFGHQWTPQFAVDYVDRICCQLTAYFSDAYSADANSHFLDCNGALYPPLLCRVENLQHANSASDESKPPGCVADTLPCIESMTIGTKRTRNCHAMCYTCPGDYSLTSGISRPPPCETCLLVDDRSVIWKKCPGPYAFCSLPPLVYEWAIFQKATGGKAGLRKLKRWKTKEEKLRSKLEERIHVQ